MMRSVSREVFLLRAEEARVKVGVAAGVLLGAAALVGDVGVLLLLLAALGAFALLVLALAGMLFS